MTPRGSRKNSSIRLWRTAAILFCAGSFLCLNVFLWTGFSAARPVGQENARPIVVGFERFFTDPGADLVAGGELLLSELRCVRCHEPDEAQASRFPSYAGPKLEGISNRVHFDYLVEWLLAPAQKKPGTTMPHLLTGETEGGRRETAVALAHYLFSLEAPALKRESAPVSVKSGRNLFHTISCVACHAPEPDFKPPQEWVGGAVEEVEISSIPLVEFGEKYTEAGLRDFLIDPLRLRPSGHMPRTPLSPNEASDLTAYLLSGSRAPAKQVSPNADLAAKGKQSFSDFGCVACHEGPGATSPKFKSLSALAGAGDEGCLAGHPLRNVPDYSLSVHQRKALRAALESVGRPRPLSPGLRIERRMMALNCFACHERDSVGGPELARRGYFVSSGDDLGDEGRLPPHLTGVGGKLTPATIESLVSGDNSARPYMTTRMPDFGARHARFFGKQFLEADLTAESERTNWDPVGRAPWGRQLIGVTGVSCISCHDLNGEKALGIRAMDLALAPRRLRREWFRDFLLDPPKFRPGTRMPSFWPDGKATHPLIGRNTERQIQSIWVYLTEIDQNRLPEGMEEDGTFELIPKDAPIVFRTFMKNAGLHAIAVGYPERLHVAFDAEEVRWALAWKGRFLDAEGTWDDRYTPLAEPLGTQILKFPPGTFLPGEHRFRGYRLDAGGAPTFLYQAGAIQVEDTLKPAATGLRRTLKLSGGSGRLEFSAPGEGNIVIDFDPQGNASLVRDVNW